MRTVVTALAFSLGLVFQAAADISHTATDPGGDGNVVLAQADCSAAASRAASRTGGQVLAARSLGNGTCEVTLLVPQEGGRPRRVVMTVSA